jgi:hypothetical protein
VGELSPGGAAAISTNPDTARAEDVALDRAAINTGVD